MNIQLRYINNNYTSNGACVLSILTQDASEALNLIFPLSVPVLLTFNTDPSFIDASAPLEKKNSKWGHLLERIHLISPSFILMLDDTTILSLFVGIQALSLT